RRTVRARCSAATSADTSPNPGPTRPVNALAGTVVLHAIGTRYVSTNRIAPGYAVTGKRADSYSASNRIERFSTATNQKARLMSPSQIAYAIATAAASATTNAKIGRASWRESA